MIESDKKLDVAYPLMLNSRPLPSVDSIHKRFPLSLDLKIKIQESRKGFQQFSSYHKALFIGPCSIHDLSKDLILGEKIANLQKEYPEFFFLYRCHLEKPRSNHHWRGFLMDPDLDGSFNLEKGIELSRKFMMELVSMGLNLSYEFIDPFLTPYVEDLVTVGMIGARTVYSQTHRQLAATLAMPVIFKNGIDGRLDGAIDAINLNQKGMQTPRMGPHGPELVFGKNVETHLMLRGGMEGPNFHLVERGYEILRSRGLESKIFVDCAHQNSNKDCLMQKKLFQDLLLQETSGIQGLMAECHLEEGNQPFSTKPKGGLSITDPCIGFASLERCLLHYKSHHLVSQGEYS
jgi:3-deoxy-7-phosphoheptulonate synthase